MNDSPSDSQNSYSRRPIRIKMPDGKPVISIITIVVTSLVFLAQYLLQMALGGDILFFYGGKINELIMVGQVWRLLTPALLHSTILHLVVNMYALYIVGRRLERFYGGSRFLALYWLSAFAGNVFSFVFTSAPSLGASTAIFGLIAAEGVFVLQNRGLFGAERTRQMLINLAIILFINLSYGFMPGTNVDNMGHIGGLLGGVFFAWKAGPLLQISGQAPFFNIIDVRKKSEAIVSGLIVLLGFAFIAFIPLLTS